MSCYLRFLTANVAVIQAPSAKAKNAATLKIGNDHFLLMAVKPSTKEIIYYDGMLAAQKSPSSTFLVEVRTANVF